MYALVIGAACGGLDLLPGFFAGYIVGYLMKYTEKYVPDGVDLIGSIVLLAPLARLIATGLTPVVNNTLLKLVTLLKVVRTQTNYYGDYSWRHYYGCRYSTVKFNGFNRITWFNWRANAIGAMAAFSSAFMNGTLFHRLKLGDRKSTISVSIEPLSQADIVSANPIPVYVTNFFGGAVAGLIIALSGMINDATGTATPIAGFLVMFGFNSPMKVIIYGVVMAIVGGLAGFLGSLVFKNIRLLQNKI